MARVKFVSSIHGGYCAMLVQRSVDTFSAPARQAYLGRTAQQPTVVAISSGRPVYGMRWAVYDQAERLLGFARTRRHAADALRWPESGARSRLAPVFVVEKPA